MNALVKILAWSGLLKGDLNLHLVKLAAIRPAASTSGWGPSRPSSRRSVDWSGYGGGIHPPLPGKV